MELRKGQKVFLDEKFYDVCLVKESSGVELDIAAFLQESNGKVGGDDDFIFYGHEIHDSYSVSIDSNGVISVNLELVPDRIEKISFTATIYDAEIRRQNFSQIRNAKIELRTYKNGKDIIFPLPKFTVETAIVLGEFYRYKNSWKFNAIGAGFSGGLAALCKNFGIEVADEMQSTPPTAPKKIELRKGQKINLAKNKSGLGEIVINLNWNQPSNTGFMRKFFNRGIDLDLACLYELKDGEIGAIQALGNHFGEFHYPPYIELDGDDRTGSIIGGETIRVNGKFINEIERILIFTFIYSGAADWQEAKGVVTVKCPGNPDLIVRMDEYGSNKPTCAIALLENIGGTFSIEKIVNFYYDSQEMDDDFDWGLQWIAGNKD